MNEKQNTPSWTERLKSVPRRFVAYKKNSISAIDEAKKERQLLAPLIFAALFFLSCVFLIGGHYRGVDFYIDNTDSFLNDSGLLQHITVFSVGTALLMGFILFTLFAAAFIFTRLACIKLFSRGSDAKTVLVEGVVEFGMNCIPLTVFFLIGGVLSDLVWWSFYPLIFFFALFFIIMLIRSIFDAVDRKKQTSLLILVMTVCLFIALALIVVFVVAVMSYSLTVIAQGIYDQIIKMLEEALAWLIGIIGAYLLIPS